MALTLRPDRVLPLLRGAFGSPYLYEDSCSSTQTLLTDDLPEGALAVCEGQTHGRGRLRRSWEAPPGRAILCSLVLRPPPDRHLPELSLVAGVAAALALEHETGLALQIKWPNDVMLNRRKVAGILAEARAGMVVLGIGLNVNQTRAELPARASVQAASLRSTDGVERDRAPLLAALLCFLEHQYGLWRAGGLPAVYPDLGARDFLRGRRVSFDGQDGTAVGIELDGRLAIDVAGSRRLVSSGDVRFVR